MDYKKLFYQESKRKFLNDVTNTVCKEAEDVDVCIKKNMKAFDEGNCHLHNKLKADISKRSVLTFLQNALINY